MKSRPRREPDTFVSGLVVGLFAGSITQFLSSPEGKNFKANISHQWRQARAELLKKGLIDESVPEAADEMLKYLWQETALGLSELKTKLAAASADSRVKKTKPKTKPKKRRVRTQTSRRPKRLKFKGV